MRFVLAVLCLSLCVPALASSQSIPMPYDPNDWEKGTEQDRLYIGAYEVLDDIVLHYQLYSGELFPDDLGGIGVIQDGFASGLGQQYQFMLIIGRWKEHLKADLDMYLTLDPPGKYADRARELRSAITQDFCLLFLGPDNAEPTTAEKLVTFYRDWVASDVRIVMSLSKKQSSRIRMETILRWAKDDGFINDGEYHQYLQDIQ